jgi:hypothetical protein
MSMPTTLFHGIHAFLLQGPSTFSCNCVAEESHFPYAENTFGWINVATVRFHRGAIYGKVSDVDEAPVSYVDEKVVAENVRADDGSRYIRDDETS